VPQKYALGWQPGEQSPYPGSRAGDGLKRHLASSDNNRNLENKRIVQRSARIATLGQVLPVPDQVPDSFPFDMGDIFMVQFESR
jgi:hypothetical protein